MRKITFILFFVPVLLITSCSKDDCIDEVLGTYIGTESCTGSINDGTIVITSSAQEDQVIFSVSGTELTWRGELSQDCESVNVPNQNIFVNGTSGNIDGSFTIVNNNLTGTINFLGSGTCSYNFTRQ